MTPSSIPEEGFREIPAHNKGDLVFLMYTDVGLIRAILVDGFDVGKDRVSKKCKLTKRQ